MRLYEYLREADLSSLENDEDIPLEEIFSDCEPFLKELKRGGYNFLYSGRMSGDPYKKKKIRKDRSPKDTPKWIHDMANDKFERKFGVRARSQSLFTFSDTTKAVSFGDPYFVFPVGKYMLIYSTKVMDLYENLSGDLKREFGEEGIKLHDKFEDTDTLVWNYNLERYEKLEEPDAGGLGALKGQHQDKSKVLTKEEYERSVEKKMESLIDTYKKTTSPQDIPQGIEAMVVTSEVWLTHTKKGPEEKEMVDAIEEYLRS